MDGVQPKIGKRNVRKQRSASQLYDTANKETEREKGKGKGKGRPSEHFSFCRSIKLYSGLFELFYSIDKILAKCL